MTAVEGGPVQATGWTADDSTFGARLALVRQRMGWGNVKEAATECGVPTESWRTWERDNVAPRNLLDVVEKISKRAGCDYAWLLAGPRLSAREGGNTLRYRRLHERRTQARAERMSSRRAPRRAASTNRPHKPDTTMPGIRRPQLVSRRAGGAA